MYDCVVEKEWLPNYTIVYIIELLTWTCFTDWLVGCAWALLNICRSILTNYQQLYRYTPEIFLFSTATLKYTYRPPQTSWTRIVGERGLLKISVNETKTCTRTCRFLVVGNIFRLETCMNSLVKVPPYYKWIFREKFSSPKTGVILLYLC
jgi:hypothetical protein